MRLMRHTVESMIERAFPVTRLRALALEVKTNDQLTGYCKFAADGSVPCRGALLLGLVFK